MLSQISKFGLVLLVFLSLIPSPVQANSGLPGTSRFGYGARVDLYGNDPQNAIEQAGNFNLDWIAIDLDWAYLQSHIDQSPNWEYLDLALENARVGDIGVMISLTNAPAWAMTADGPDPNLTIALIEQLLTRYSGGFQALELFPMANTRLGWGTAPNPQAYGKLINIAAQVLNPEIVLVAGGLMPPQLASDFDDLTFLKEIYHAGAADFSVLGLRLPPLGISPLTPLNDTDLLVLRHYEDIREVMMENGHQNGLIWITGFSWDDDEIHSSLKQAAWLKQAYLLFRAQLYIGAAFFDSLNLSAKGSNAQLLGTDDHHPGFDELIQIIALDHHSQTIHINLEFNKKLLRRKVFKGG
jgi:hypothetical protein